jgi:chromosomal replication initiation ATPase DnaA
MKKEIMEAYVGVVLNRFYISEDEFFKKNKSRRLANARYLFYYLCRDRNIMIADIQRFMNENGYDVPHTTVIYGSGVMKKRVEEDRDYKDVLNGIKERIRIN